MGQRKIGGNFGSRYLGVSHPVPYWSWVLGRCSFVCPLIPFWEPQSGYLELLIAFESTQTSKVLENWGFLNTLVDGHRTNTDVAVGAGPGLTRDSNLETRLLSFSFYASLFHPSATISTLVAMVISGTRKSQSLITNKHYNLLGISGV